MRKLTEDELDYMWNELIRYANMIKNDVLNEVANQILKDYKEKYYNKPATSNNSSHHFYKAGLLHHTYTVVKNSYTIYKLYDSEDIDLDLIIFGALFHDLGKTLDYLDFEDIDEDSIDMYNLKYDYSNLLSHSYEGTYIVQSYLDKYNINKVFKYQVLHMIACHMKDSFPGGSINTPQMLETFILNFADHMDSAIAPMLEELKNTKNGEYAKRLSYNGSKIMKSINI